MSRVAAPSTRTNAADLGDVNVPTTSDPGGRHAGFQLMRAVPAAGPGREIGPGAIAQPQEDTVPRSSHADIGPATNFGWEVRS